MKMNSHQVVAMLSGVDCLRPLTGACPSALHRLASVSAVRRPFSSVVCLAKPPRAADFRGLSREQIEEEVTAAKRALFDLRVKQRTRQVSCHPLLQPHASWQPLHLLLPVHARPRVKLVLHTLTEACA